MGNLDFISDVIYGLKMDMGQLIYAGKNSIDRDVITGERTNTQDRFAIPNAIYLPLNLRRQFLQQVGIHKVMPLEAGNREVLIDKVDIPATKTLATTEGFLEIKGKQTPIIAIEDYEHAYIVVVKQISGMP